MGSESRIKQTVLSAGSGKAPRMANLELLRCIAMMMVVVLHYLGKGGILPNLAGGQLTVAGTVAWVLESCCIVAVNVYMLLSGYFLCTSSFKLSRLIQLYLQVWFYSAGVGVLCLLTGIFPRAELTVHDLLTMAFPVSMGHYWFITAYVFLYLLLPFLSGTVQRMTREQMRLAIGILLFFFCLLKTVLPVRLEMDGVGYDYIWYLCVFLTAAYIRRFGAAFLKKCNHSFLLYLLGVLGIFGLTMVLRQVYLITGSMGRMITMALEYNHLFPFLASLGLFGVFLHLEIKGITSVIVNKIAPLTLGVYLLHENIGLRYVWQNWLGAVQVIAAESVFTLLLCTLGAVALVFTVGILVEWLRSFFMGRAHRLFLKVGLYRRIATAIGRADKIFASEGRIS